MDHEWTIYGSAVQEVLVGVTYDPIADELFWATKGGGAFRRSPRISGSVAVPLRTSTATGIAQALIAVECGYRRDEKAISLFAKRSSALLRRGVRSLRMPGACGLALAYVAAGRLDCFFEQNGPKIWDFAGGSLLVREAGGVVQDPRGDAHDLMGRSVLVASSAALCDDVVSAINQ